MSEELPMQLTELRKVISPMLPGLLGIDLLEATPERVTGRLTVRPQLSTSRGVLHGGAIMSLGDTLGAIGTFLNMPRGYTTTTIESSTKFLAAAPGGTTVTGESIPLHRGRTTMVWQTTIRREDGRTCALVLQTQLVIAPQTGAA